MTERQADYILCNSPASIQSALADLTTSPVLFVDCEGRDLGTFNGRLSVISIRTTGSETFVIDVVSLGAQRLRPIFDILESSTIVKVMFDGRKDFCAFYHDFGVSLQNVIDLQLVDIQSRHQRFRGKGKYAKDRIQRLLGFLPEYEIQGNRSLYGSVEKLSGLGECMKEHRLEIPPKKKVDHTEWMQRPLSKKYLRYAAEDVRIIECLYDEFSSKGYIDSHSADASIRYISIWSDEQPDANDRYRANPLLPLNILYYRQSSELASTRSCIGCARDLPKECFSNNAWKGGAVRRMCWVCRAVDVWSTMPWVVEKERRKVQQQRRRGYAMRGSL